MMIDPTYRRFSAALLPIFRGLSGYCAEFQQAVQLLMNSTDEDKNNFTAIQDIPAFINRMLLWHDKVYPEWVLKRGFNPHLRGGFRYVLLHLDESLEAFLSLDFHLKQVSDLLLIQDIAPQLIDVSTNNKKMLEIITAFFAAEPVDQSHENFTSDVTDLYNVARGVLPESMELLDLRPDYMHVAAIMRDVIDIRQLLLKILTALPIDDLAVKE